MQDRVFQHPTFQTQDDIPRISASGTVIIAY